MSLASCWIYLTRYGHGAVQGYLLFPIEGAGLFVILMLIVLRQDFVDLRVGGASTLETIRLRRRVYLLIGGLIVLLLATSWASAGRIFQAVAT